MCFIMTLMNVTSQNTTSVAGVLISKNWEVTTEFSKQTKKNTDVEQSLSRVPGMIWLVPALPHQTESLPQEHLSIYSKTS